MKKQVATTLAFLIAPLIAAIAFVAIKATQGYFDLFDIVWVFIFYFYSLGVTLIIGLPVYVLLNRFNKIAWWSAILTGLFCSTVVIFIFDSLSFSVIPIGGLSALVFWLIWRWGNP